jgi:predicted branched-subunit amino acid permease
MSLSETKKPEQPTAAPAPSFTAAGVVHGIVKATVLAPSVIAFGLAVGVLAAAKGLTTLEAALMSAWVNAGSAQMAALQIWTHPLPVFTLALTVLAMNARYVLLGASLQPHFGKLPWWQIYPSLFVMGDGNWALTLREVQERRFDGGFLLGSGLVMFLLWSAAVVVGQLFGLVIGDPRRYGIDFMLAAFFATLAVGFFRAHRGVAPLVVAIAVAVAIERLVPGPWYLFAGALAGSLVGAWLPNDAR